MLRCAASSTRTTCRCGCDAAIHTVFTSVFGDHYDEGKTQSMIDHARLRRYKPFKRATVHAMANRGKT